MQKKKDQEETGRNVQTAATSSRVKINQPNKKKYRIDDTKSSVALETGLGFVWVGMDSGFLTKTGQDLTR